MNNDNDQDKKEKQKIEPVEIPKKDAGGGESFGSQAVQNNSVETLEKVKEKLAKCEGDKEEYLNGWKRAKADFINYKKDEVKRMEEIAKYVCEPLFEEFISVLDNFDLSLCNLEKAGPVEKGIYLIRSQIEDILEKKGLSKISAEIGSQFDPAVAEAVAETESEMPPGSIVEEIAPGYRLYGKLIRPARVKVSKPKT